MVATWWPLHIGMSARTDQNTELKCWTIFQVIVVVFFSFRRDSTLWLEMVLLATLCIFQIALKFFLARHSFYRFHVYLHASLANVSKWITASEVKLIDFDTKYATAFLCVSSHTGWMEMFIKKLGFFQILFDFEKKRNKCSSNKMQF